MTTETTLLDRILVVLAGDAQNERRYRGMGFSELLSQLDEVAEDVDEALLLLEQRGALDRSRMGKFATLTLSGRESAHHAGANTPSPSTDAQLLIDFLRARGDGTARGRGEIDQETLRDELGFGVLRALDAATWLEIDGDAQVCRTHGHFTVKLTLQGRS